MKVYLPYNLTQILAVGKGIVTFWIIYNLFYLPIITLVDLCLGEKVGSRVGVSAAGPHRSSAGFGGRGVSLDMSNTGNFSSRVHNWLFLGGEGNSSILMRIG